MQAINAPGFPLRRGVQLTKEVAYLNMREAAAASSLSQLWSDTFLTNAGIDAANSSAYTYRGAANFDVIPNLVAADLTGGQTFTASATYAGSDVANAFDNDAGTYWNPANNNATPQWIKVQFGTAKTIRKITLNFFQSGDYSWTLEGSNDNSAWTTIHSEAVKAYVDGVVGSTTFANATAYLYYRLTITATTAPAFLCIREMELMEADPTQAVIQSVRALNLSSAITTVIPFVNVTPNSGALASVQISTDDGSTWTTVTADQINTVPSGQQIKMRVTLTGDAELESWGIAA